MKLHDELAERDRGIAAPSLPRPWEDDVTFSDVLYEWMQRAPWVGISAALHAIVLMILMAIPWEYLRSEEDTVFNMTPEQTVADTFEVREPEPPPPVETPEKPVEPQLVDSLLPSDDVAEAPAEASSVSDVASLSEVDFGTLGELGELGIGVGGGKFIGRFGRGPGGRGSKRHTTITNALDWLAAHQDTDGKWDADGFMKHDPPDAPTDGPGHAQHDVGLTGLALLAFLGEGNTMSQGAYSGNVRRGITWLLDQRDPDSGLLGEPVGPAFLYDHAIATLSLCEAFYFSHSPILGRAAQDAVNYIGRARNPYGAWRYAVPPNGESDTSVTGWMVLALTSANDAGLVVDTSALEDALTFLDEMTDPETGRVGYDERGSRSARITRVNDHYPVDRGEALTGVGLLCRVFLGQTPEQDPILLRHADLLAQRLPEWDPAGLGNDMYAWYYGSYAMFQVGGRHWKTWSQALDKAVVESQRKDASFAGSWDPNGPWGFAGGRVYSTALMALTLEVYFRYGRVLGAR